MSRPARTATTMPGAGGDKPRYGVPPHPGTSVGDGLVPSRSRGNDNARRGRGQAPPLRDSAASRDFRRGRACPVPLARQRQCPARAGTSPAPTGFRPRPGTSVGDGLVPSRSHGNDNARRGRGRAPPLRDSAASRDFRRGRACPVPLARQRQCPARAGTSPAPAGFRGVPGHSGGDGLVPSRFPRQRRCPAQAGARPSGRDSPAPTGFGRVPGHSVGDR